MANEGKADPKQAVDDLKKAVEEEEVIKKELEAEINPKDKELDIAPEEPTVEPAPVRIASNEFEFTGDTEESITKDPILPADPMTGFSKGGKALKGGLAKAVAKTKAYEEQKNPGPKRM